jgi:hypothetical protein
MSCPINVEEAQGSRAISVADSAPGDATPAVTEISATGKRGIPVFVAPLHSQRECDGRGRRGATVEEMMGMGFQGFLLLEARDDDDLVTQRKKWFKEMRGWLMVLATVAASVTYQAGLNPPGGFWQEGDDAGNPVLRDKHWSRYMIFYYFNATAFVTSLVIMVLLMSERFYHTEAKVVALMLTTFIDLISLIGAYIAGTTRFFSSCIYIIVIACVAFAGVIYIGEYVRCSVMQYICASAWLLIECNAMQLHALFFCRVMEEICKFFMRKMPCMLRLLQSRWFPVPAEVVRSLQLPEERINQTRTTARNNQRGGSCACCAPRAEG